MRCCYERRVYQCGCVVGGGGWFVQPGSQGNKASVAVGQGVKYTARSGGRRVDCWRSLMGVMMRVEGRVFVMPDHLQVLLESRGPLVALGAYLRD